VTPPPIELQENMGGTDLMKMSSDDGATPLIVTNTSNDLVIYPGPIAGSEYTNDGATPIVPISSR